MYSLRGRAASKRPWWIDHDVVVLRAAGRAQRSIGRLLDPVDRVRRNIMN